MPSQDSSTNYVEIYTHSPEPHPNLALGGLQLLFWLFFRPKAWYKHAERIRNELHSVDDLKKRLVWQSALQGYLIVPFWANFILGLVLLALGQALPHIFSILTLSLGCCVALSVALGVALGVAGDVALGVAGGVAFGVPLGVALGVAGGVALGVALGVAFGVAFGVVGDIALGVAGGVAFGVAFGVVGDIALGVVEGSVVGGVVGGVAVGVAEGMAGGLVVGVGATINLWRPVLSFPFLAIWNYQLYRLDKERNGRSPCLLRFHSAFWDEWQSLHLLGLDKHLLFVIAHNPVEGQAAIDYLNDSPQKWVVQVGRDALRLRNCADVQAIRQYHSSIVIDELQNLPSSILSIFTHTSKDVDAALEQISKYNQRLILNTVADRLNRQLENFNRTKNKYASFFYPFAKIWLEIINNYAEDLAKITELRQEIDSPYIIGIPLTLEQEIFTGCDDIGTRIEQLLRDRRRPPLLLYGQRRMGKTSLLNNIGKLLPNSIIPMFVDLQGASSSASDHTGFLYNLAREMEKSAKKQGVTLPSLAREVLQSDPFTYFYEWLDKVEQALEQNTALLALDEFEVLDNAIAKGRFDEQDVLGMLRHLIQHRPRFKVLLAGSHTIEEYQRWASYLINVQVVHISYLKEAEARQLIEHPVKDFTLCYEPNAVERVLQLTRCHPFLVQLLCAEIIVLKNEQDPSMRRLATLADVEAAIPEALQSGGFFFADIQNNQVDATGQAILRFIAAQGEGAIVSRQTLLQQFPNEITFNLLLQRELIEEVDDGYSFQVELIRRWFI
ncbi:MAG: AAA family ATPase [Nostoc sp.]|uniref:AAA family ATPase n=1 Tax=Nostoc sp. TaxID=1180 RepID=UPI002FF4DC2B